MRVASTARTSRNRHRRRCPGHPSPRQERQPPCSATHSSSPCAPSLPPPQQDSSPPLLSGPAAHRTDSGSPLPTRSSRRDSPTCVSLIGPRHGAEPERPGRVHAAAVSAPNRIRRIKDCHPTSPSRPDHPDADRARPLAGPALPELALEGNLQCRSRPGASLRCRAAALHRTINQFGIGGGEARHRDPAGDRRDSGRRPTRTAGPLGRRRLGSSGQLIRGPLGPTRDGPRALVPQAADVPTATAEEVTGSPVRTFVLWAQNHALEFLPD
ncbi:hypothetical protein J2Z21_008326 [Streptomyces griseochromogenes]|uniref:Uncharacterized protein n=1 Tax=Streptomyces griseochromogenes TaxID=68214 RepID=A0ABS4M6K0_9ACTN|nr:hypothetical protein [Streptomyces griseochromogenes]